MSAVSSAHFVCVRLLDAGCSMLYISRPWCLWLRLQRRELNHIHVEKWQWLESVYTWSLVSLPERTNDFIEKGHSRAGLNHWLSFLTLTRSGQGTWWRSVMWGWALLEHLTHERNLLQSREKLSVERPEQACQKWETTCCWLPYHSTSRIHWSLENFNLIMALST